MIENERSQKFILVISSCYILVFSIILMVDYKELFSFFASQTSFENGGRKQGPLIISFIIAIVLAVYSYQNIRRINRLRKKGNSE